MEVKGPSGPSKTSKTSKSKKSSSSSAAGAFSALIEGTESSSADATSAASGVHAAAGIDAILAAQAIDPDEVNQGKKRAVRRGFDLLDSLDDIRMGLLLGQISGKRLYRLQELIAQQKDAVDDPKLMEILEEIDLRAAVELAKFERDQS